MPSEKLPRASILRRRADFSKARDKGRRVVGAYLLLNWFVDEKSLRQLGVVVSKAVGGAVQRNRLKRRIREAYRRLQNELREGLKSIWVVRKRANEASYEELRSEMEKIYRKEKLIAKKEESNG